MPSNDKGKGRVEDRPPRVPDTGEEEEFDSDDDDDDDGDEGQEPEFDAREDLPITHEITLKDHTKVVSALALDPSGARIISGSHDYDCKLWDFGGMTTTLKPFKSWEPAGTYYVSVAFYSLSGSSPLRRFVDACFKCFSGSRCSFC